MGDETPPEGTSTQPGTPAGPAPQKKKIVMDWVKNGRREILFAQILSVGVKAFLTNRANIQSLKGKGGVTYNRKELWEKEIMPYIDPDKVEEFKGAPLPDHQGIMNYIDRELNANKHLYEPGKEQAEPAEAGTSGTKNEEFTDWHRVRVASYSHRPSAPTDITSPVHRR